MKKRVVVALGHRGDREGSGGRPDGGRDQRR